MILEQYFVMYCIVALVLLLIFISTHILDRFKYKSSGWLDLIGLIVLAIEYFLYTRLYNYTKDFILIIILIFEIIAFLFIYKSIGLFAINNKKQILFTNDALSTFLYFKIIFPTLSILISKSTAIFQINQINYVDSMQKVLDMFDLSFVNVYDYINKVAVPGAIISPINLVASITTCLSLILISRWMIWSFNIKDNHKLNSGKFYIWSFLITYVNNANYSLQSNEIEIQLITIGLLICWIMLWKTFLCQRNPRLPIHK